MFSVCFPSFMQLNSRWSCARKSCFGKLSMKPAASSESEWTVDQEPRFRLMVQTYWPTSVSLSQSQPLTSDLCCHYSPALTTTFISDQLQLHLPGLQQTVFVCVLVCVWPCTLLSAPGRSHRRTLWPLATLWRLKQEKQTRERLQPRCSSTNTMRSERSTGAVKATSVYRRFIMWCLTFTNEFNHTLEQSHKSFGFIHTIKKTSFSLLQTSTIMLHTLSIIVYTAWRLYLE